MTEHSAACYCILEIVFQKEANCKDKTWKYMKLKWGEGIVFFGEDN